MDIAFENALIQCKPELCRCLTLTELLAQLHSKKVLSLVMINEIKAESTEFERNVHLIDTLIKRDSHTFLEFIKALFASGQDHLAHLLVNTVLELRSTTEEGPTTSKSAMLSSNLSLTHRSPHISRPSSSEAIISEEITIDENYFHSANDSDFIFPSTSKSRTRLSSAPELMVSDSISNHRRADSAASVLGLLHGEMKRKSTTASRLPNMDGIEIHELQPLQTQELTVNPGVLLQIRKAFSCYYIFNLGFAFFLLVCLIFHLYLIIKLFFYHQYDASYSALQEDEFVDKGINFHFNAPYAHKHDIMITKVLLISGLQICFVVACFFTWAWKLLQTGHLINFAIFTIFFCSEIGLFFLTFYFLSGIEKIGLQVTSEFLSGIRTIQPAELVGKIFKCCPNMDSTRQMDSIGPQDYEKKVELCWEIKQLLTCENRIQETLFKINNVIFGGQIVLIVVFVIGLMLFFHKWIKIWKINQIARKITGVEEGKPDLSLEVSESTV